MSRHAHLVVEYKCEYGDEDFGSQARNVYRLLASHGVEIHRSDDNYEYCDWEIQCEDGNFAKLIDRLEAKPPDKVNKFFRDEEKNSQYTNGQLVSIFKKWLKYMDKDDLVVRVHWW